MAYTQAKVKTDIYLQLPKGTTIPGADSTKHILKLQQNLYGLRDGQVTWHEHIEAGLKEQGFHQSTVDPCLFIKGKVLLVLYIDDAAFFSPNAKDINTEIVSLRKSFDKTDKGKLQDYPGMCFIRHPNRIIELQQQKAIDHCLDFIGMGSSADTEKLHDTPAKATIVLHKDETGPPCKQSWNYQAVIGCLNYLQAMTQPDLSYLVHQCAHFCNDPKLSHEQAIKCICHYLCSTRNKGLFFLPDLHTGFTCHVDTDWADN